MPSGKLRNAGAALILFAVSCPATAQAQADADSRFRTLYRDLIETDSSPTTGSCTGVAEKARAYLLDAGFSAGDVELVLAPDLPRDGNLVAHITGTDPRAEPILLLAHIDVVPVKAGDWQRDPFKLIEENGYYYGRGTVDDKAMATIFVDSLARLKKEGFRPRRTIKLALTCGEESGGRLRGIRYLIDKRPETVKAAFAINEGGSGYLDENGKPLTFMIEGGQKAYQDFKLTATGPGAHSSRPGADNILTRMGAVLVRIGEYRFPAQIGAVTRNFFARSAASETGQIAADMKAVGAGSDDPAAIDRLSAGDPVWNAMIRTTCVTTLINGGHSKAALAQSVEVNVNCRILPGQSVKEVREQLTRVVADPTISIADNSPVLDGITAPSPQLSPEIFGPIESVANEIWPGVPVIPGIVPGASDGRFLNAAGIPTFGASGVFRDPDGNGVHGLNERLRVKSLLDARTFLYRLIKRYTAGKGK